MMRLIGRVVTLATATLAACFSPARGFSMESIDLVGTRGGGGGPFDVLQYMRDLQALHEELKGTSTSTAASSPCWKEAAKQINVSCPVLTDNLKREVAYDLTVCHVKLSGRTPPPCATASERQQNNNVSLCTAKMSSEHFLVFTDFYTHVEARSCLPPPPPPPYNTLSTT